MRHDQLQRRRDEHRHGRAGNPPADPHNNGHTHHQPPADPPEQEHYLPGHGQTRVDVRNDALAAEWLRLELGRRELSGIFRREALLVHTPRIGEEGYLPPADLGLIDAGPAQVRPITTIGVKSLIETRYDCWKTITVHEDKENEDKNEDKRVSRRRPSRR